MSAPLRLFPLPRAGRLLAMLAALAVVACLGAGPAAAATFTVNTTTDATDVAAGNGICSTGAGQCSVRAAIQEANGSAGTADTIVIPAGTFTISIGGTGENASATGDFDITTNITLQGAGSASTRLDGGKNDRVLEVLGGAGNATISGLTITNGASGASPGGGLANSATASLTNVVVDGNTATGGGGGINNSNVLTLTNVTLSNNAGGAGTTVTGGGLLNSNRADLTNVSVTGNTIGGNGGGIFTSGFAPAGLRATDVTVSGNQALRGGGVYASAAAVLTRVTVTNNTATATTTTGGGIATTASASERLAATDSSITGNHIPTNGQGGGLQSSGAVDLVRVTIASNSALAGAGGAFGGGIYNTGTLNGTDLGVMSNTLGSASDGGGIWNSGGLTLVRTTVAANAVGRDGGGIWNNGFGIQLTTVTIDGNSALRVGGGFFTGADAVVHNSTIAGNSAPTASGASTAASTFPSTAQNTIIAGNTGGPQCGGPAGSLVSNGNNLAGDASCRLAGAGDLTAADPRLAALADNGGFVRTRALLSDSPALDTGADSACPSPDARGVTRPQLTHCDIGAYEYSPPSSSSSPPQCSTASGIGVQLATAAGGAQPTRLHYRLDGGAEQQSAVSAGAGSADVPGGRHSLEFWGESLGGDLELAHHTTSVLVDPSAPNLSILSDQGRTTYLVGSRASVSIFASEPFSQLVSDPSVSGRVLDTSRPGPLRVDATATDLCGNQAQAAFIGNVVGAPIAGRRFNAERVSGTVLVKGVRARRFVPLVEPSQIEVGAIIDATEGRVRITIANAKGGFDTAEFYGGKFKLLQPKVKRGKTRYAVLVLIGGNFKGCPKAPKAILSGKGKSRSVRHLWGDGNGAFRTVGRFSSATIRGTIWLTDDRCNGTLTRVTKGKVGVRDFVRRKVIVLTAPKKYLAKAKPRSSR